MSIAPAGQCARCFGVAPGNARGGSVKICSRSQPEVYFFEFCGGCFPRIHAELGALLGRVCAEVPLKERAIPPPKKSILLDAWRAIRAVRLVDSSGEPFRKRGD